MKKIINLDGIVDAAKIRNGMYLYRIASVSVDKVTLEKHFVKIDDSFENKKVASISDDTKVGTVTQRLTPKLVADISKRVDEVAVDFEMGEKNILGFDFKGVTEVRI